MTYNNKQTKKRVVKKRNSYVKKPVLLLKPKKTHRRRKIPSLRIRLSKGFNTMMRGKSSLSFYYLNTVYKLKDGNFIEFIQEARPESPRSWDNLGTILCWSRAVSGDENPYDSPEEFFEDYNNKNAIIYFIDAYIHSGISLKMVEKPKTRDKWDSAIIGVIYVPFEKIRKEYNCKNITESIREKVKTCLKTELRTYNQWIEGEVYGYRIYNANGTELDSCYGFYNLDDTTDYSGYGAKDIVGEAEIDVDIKYH